jgi:hypothetical protein
MVVGILFGDEKCIFPLCNCEKCIFRAKIRIKRKYEKLEQNSLIFSFLVISFIIFVSKWRGCA